jgi:hypothetical protein
LCIPFPLKLGECYWRWQRLFYALCLYQHLKEVRLEEAAKKPGDPQGKEPAFKP